MTTVLAIIGGILGLGGAAAFVVSWIKGRLSDEVSLSQRDAALKVEADRVAVMEAAAVKERAQRQSELDGKLSAVSDSKSAADLLRSEFSGSGKPKTN